eukprot:Gb_39488 [translate_table: standard]
MPAMNTSIAVSRPIMDAISLRNVFNYTNFSASGARLFGLNSVRFLKRRQRCGMAFARSGSVIESDEADLKDNATVGAKRFQVDSQGENFYDLALPWQLKAGLTPHQVISELQVYDVVKWLLLKCLMKFFYEGCVAFVFLCWDRKPEADVVVIGSGVGGLCAAGLLARYGQDVLVLESHDLPGGAAHSFEIKGYKFDSGPSLFSGLSSRGPQANPLAQDITTKVIGVVGRPYTPSGGRSGLALQTRICSFSACTAVHSGHSVLDALGESVPGVTYDSWMVYLPEGDFLTRIGPTEFFKVQNLP